MVLCNILFYTVTCVKDVTLVDLISNSVIFQAHHYHYIHIYFYKLIIMVSLLINICIYTHSSGF